MGPASLIKLQFSITDFKNRSKIGKCGLCFTMRNPNTNAQDLTSLFFLLFRLGSRDGSILQFFLTGT